MARQLSMYKMLEDMLHHIILWRLCSVRSQEAPFQMIEQM
jgi:hypothetical protein